MQNAMREVRVNPGNTAPKVMPIIVYLLNSDVVDVWVGVGAGWVKSMVSVRLVQERFPFKEPSLKRFWKVPHIPDISLDMAVVRLMLPPT
jgi:hypothetical protein